MRLSRVIAHRGASLLAPENTIAAFKKAKALGAEWVETDVMLTQDGVPILHHDVTLERTTGLLANVADTPYAKIKALESDGEPIPTLEEALNFLNTLELKLNLEIKPLPGQDAETAEAAVQMCLQKHFPPNSLLISSGSLVALGEAMRIAPELHYGFVADDLNALEQGLQSGLDFYSIHINEKFLDNALIEKLISKGYKVLAYTVNHTDRMQHLFDMGVTAVFSDDPVLGVYV
jgi:glycerophosphoryl diester phosphodiesterase